jgi:coproporphyrinogen III oxidase-like Fe-S oxidoreductase
MRCKQPKEYLEQGIKGKAVQQENEVEVRDLGFEFMMNALRLIDGFPAGLFEERTGLPIVAVQRELDEAERRGLIVRDHHNIAPTLRGQRFLNYLLQIFIQEPGPPGSG